LDKIHIVICTNKNYLPGAFVTLGSLLDANGGRNEFHLHVMDSGIGDEGRGDLARFIGRYPNATLTVHVIDASCFKDCRRDYGGGFSTYSRLFMGSLIHAPRCIYIDVDFLVLKDVAELWTRDMGGKIMLAIRDYDISEGTLGTLDCDCPFMPPEEAKKYPYYCAGILLCDLDAWRAFDTEKKAFELIRQAPQQLKAWDQTALGYLLRDHLGELERPWAYHIDLEPFHEDVNYHFITKKKPRGRIYFVPVNDLWWAYYRIRVRPFWRFRKSWKTRVYNACWTLRSLFFAFVFTETYIRFRRRAGATELSIVATRAMLKTYRRYVLHGLDPQSRTALRNQTRRWKELP